MTTLESQPPASSDKRPPPAPDFDATLFSGQPPDVTALGEELSGLDLVPAREFQTICTLAGGNRVKVLEELERAGLLTRFQVQQILSGSVANIVFDEYILLDRLGEGGMGEVFKARNRPLDRIEAIKAIRFFEGADESLSKRFQQEARVLARLKHPGIVPIYKVGRFQTIDYIAMEYVEGEPLKAHIDRANQLRQFLPLEAVCRWITEAAEALDFAHRHEIIHRDVKPANLMLTTAGHVIVLDMGIARLAGSMTAPSGEGLTTQSHGIGTPPYMPPEQWADARMVTPASDIYALGCTLFHLLTGRVPYTGDPAELLRAHMSEPIPKASALRQDLPAELDTLLARMLAKEPDERFQSAAEVAEALRSLADPAARRPMALKVDENVESRATVTQRKAPTGGTTIRWLCLAAALAGVGGLSLGWMWTRNPSLGSPSETALEPAILGRRGETTEKDGEAKAIPAAPSASTFSTPATSPPADPSTNIGLDFANRARSWLVRHRADHAATWPDDQEWADFRSTLGSLEQVDSSERLASLQRAVERETEWLRAPWKAIRPKEALPQSAQMALAAIEVVARLHAQPPDPSLSAEVYFVDRDKAERLSRGNVGQLVKIAVARPARGCYATFVRVEGGRFTLVTNAVPLRAQEVEAWLRGDLALAAPGQTTHWVYLTERPLFHDETTIDLSDAKAFAGLFESPRAARRVWRSLERGTAVPPLGPHATAPAWNRLPVSVEVVP